MRKLLRMLGFKRRKKRVKWPKVSDVVVAELTVPEGVNREWEGNAVERHT